MAEISPKVYDILHPTPLSLKELSAIATSREMWRQEVIKHRENKTLESFDPRDLLVTLFTASLPDVPSTIRDINRKYLFNFGVSITEWLEYHTGSSFDYGRSNYILEDFDDFVCDYYGAIHFARTAERMLRCNGFSDAMKFNIACTYCLEDDIRRMWPPISKSIDIDSIDFNKHPHMYYWICRLTNKLDKIVPTGVNGTVDEEMFDRHHLDNIPSLEYFWNGVSRENKMEKALDVCGVCVIKFVRIILPKLDDQQLGELVNEHYYWLMDTVLWHYGPNERIVLNTWSRIRSVLNLNTFKNHFFVRGMLRDVDGQAEDKVFDRIDYIPGRSENTHLNLCLKIWNSVPDTWKQSVIEDLLGSTLLEKHCDQDSFDIRQINVKLLLFILRSASFEEMNSFWHNSWHMLVANARGEYLQRIMNVCFENEHQIAEFKRDRLATNPNVRKFCVQLLHSGEYFEYLNELVSFIYPEKQNERNFKQQILRLCFLDEHCFCGTHIIYRPETLIDFVTDAYVDLSTDFKTQLMSSPSFLNRVWHFTRMKEISAEQLLKFFITFVPTEETEVQIKMVVAESLKQYMSMTHDARLRGQDRITCEDHFSSVLTWCLGHSGEIEKFLNDE